jgi:hypothetical protein
MASRIGHARTVLLVIVSAVLVAAVGGTAFAASGSGGSRSSSGLTKSDVKQIVAAYVKSHETQIVQPYINSHKNEIVQSYINAHLSQIRGPKPSAINFSTTDNTGKAFLVRNIGPWTMSATCTSSGGVTVFFNGPNDGVQLGTNTLAAVNSGAGSTYETLALSGQARSFGAGPGNQGTQTVHLTTGTTTYGVTYFESALDNSPVDCTVVGYVIPL